MGIVILLCTLLFWQANLVLGQNIAYEAFGVYGLYYFGMGQAAMGEFTFVSDAKYEALSSSSISTLQCNPTTGCVLVDTFSIPFIYSSGGLGLNMAFKNGLLASTCFGGIATFDCRNITNCRFSTLLLPDYSPLATIAINDNNIMATMNPDPLGIKPGLYAHHCPSPISCTQVAFLPLTTFPYNASAAFYGTSLDWIGVNYLLVGGPYAATTIGLSGPVKTGAVIVFDFSNINNIRLISVLFPQFGAQFGISVSPYGNRVVVGAPGITTVSGSHVELFECQLGICQLLDVINGTAKTFGSTLALYENTLIVSETSEDTVDYPHETGAFFLYDCPVGVGCVLIEMLSPNASFFDQIYWTNDLGHSISMNQDTVLLGIPYALQYSGRVLILDRTNLVPTTPSSSTKLQIPASMMSLSLSLVVYLLFTQLPIPIFLMLLSFFVYLLF